MKEASALASHRIARATSSGCPPLPIESAFQNKRQEQQGVHAGGGVQKADGEIRANPTL
ncbi:hypothetical protein ACPOL_0595 [Acidisarcina polymorpha]|uniref:Uncharacterized protein n=1 Tax=Acidisarcina polymorpha TaxID=2211140 RepID=A0A2Z5FU03_9BACT|nr:hypothetical protein ACPOL_0595 [Acidisarcina polymorpha]